MTTLREAAAMALEALEESEKDGHYLPVGVIEPLRKALAQPEPEPVAWTDENFMEIYVSKDIAEDIGAVIELYTTPLQRKPLTDEEINKIVREAAKGSAIRRDGSTSQRIARAIERAHGIGREE